MFPWKTSHFTAKSLRATVRVVVCAFVFICALFPDSTLSSFRTARRSRRQRIPINIPKLNWFLWVFVCVGERGRGYMCVCGCVIKTLFLDPKKESFNFSGPTGRGESCWCNYLLVEVFRHSVHGQPWQHMVTTLNTQELGGSVRTTSRTGQSVYCFNKVCLCVCVCVCVNISLNGFLLSSSCSPQNSTR